VSEYASHASLQHSLLSMQSVPGGLHSGAPESSPAPAVWQVPSAAQVKAPQQSASLAQSPSWAAHAAVHAPAAESQ
jgi:hypothetical protein